MALLSISTLFRLCFNTLTFQFFFFKSNIAFQRKVEPSIIYFNKATILSFRLIYWKSWLCWSFPVYIVIGIKVEASLIIWWLLISLPILIEVKNIILWKQIWIYLQAILMHISWYSERRKKLDISQKNWILTQKSWTSTQKSWTLTQKLVIKNIKQITRKDYFALIKVSLKPS